MGSSGGGGGGTTTIRYAPYIETQHMDFLLKTAQYRDSTIDNNPFSGYDDIPVDEGFFGAGYTLASFPSLYDMFGKFMAGLNIEAVWSELVEATINGPETNNYIRAEGDFLQDQLDTEVLPRFMTGMRDMNAVMSSSFVIGKALLQDTKQKSVAKFSSELKYKLIPLAQARWDSHLGWNRGVIDMYANVMKHFFTIKDAMTELNYKIKEKDALWPLEVMEYERAALGALQGATKTKTQANEMSTGSKVLGGALGGAALGASVGGVYGAVIGGVVGGLAGLLS